MLCSPAGFVGEMQWQEAVIHLTIPGNNLLVRSNPNRIYLAFVASLVTTGQPNFTTNASLPASSPFGYPMNSTPVFELSFHTHGVLVGQAWYCTGIAANGQITMFEVCIGTVTPLQ